MEKKTVNGNPFIRYKRPDISSEELIQKSSDLEKEMQARRSVREFSDKPIPKEVIQNLLAIANSAPSGANKQPWTFCVVSNPELKRQIREAAEKEEYENYNGRMNQEWLHDLKPFGTIYLKPFLEIAPYLIVVLKRAYEVDEFGQKHQNYYVNESVGIASGFLLSAIHQAGLVSLTHTPSPMNFLHTLLNRPDNERAFLLIPVAYPHDDCWIPDIKRKSEDDYAVFYE